MDADTHDPRPQMIDLSTLEEDRDYQSTGRQRSARTDPSMRDGDSGHGNPYEYDPGDGEPSTDSDVGDEVDETDDELIAFAGASGGAVGGTPANKRAEGGTMPDGEPVGADLDTRDGSTICLADVPTRSPAPAASSDLPIPEYTDLSVPEIISRLGTMPREQLERVQEYESKHRKRKTLLTKLTRMLRDNGSS